MGPSKCVGAVLIVISLAASSGRSAAQSIITFQNEVVARTGGSVPGVPGAVFNFSSPELIHPFMQDDGRVFFHAPFSGGGAQFGLTDHALFWGDKASLIKVVRWGDAEPSGTLPGATISKIFDDIPLGANGAMMFGGRVAGPGITFSNDGVIYAGTPGNFQLIAREGSQAADSPPGALHGGQDFGVTQGILNTNASGHVAFSSTLTGTLNGVAIFAGPPAALVRIMTFGEVVGPNLTINNLPQLVQINASGQVLIDLVNYQSVTINNQTVVGPENNGSVWLYTPGAGKQEIFREGTLSPIAGAKYADLIHGGTTLKCGFNANGQVLLRSGLANIGAATAVTFGVNDQVIMLVSAGSQTLVARRGDPAPGIPGATFDFPNGDIELRLNDNGQVCFSSPIAGVGVTPANDSAMWVGTPGNLTLVAREGSVAPGTGGLTFGAMPGSKLFNAAGQVVFISLLGGAPFPVFTHWCWDAVAGLQLVDTSNDMIEASPGNFQTIGGFGFLAHSNGDSRPPSFANDGTLAGRTGFGIVKTRIGSLTGTPRTISAAAGGTHSLFLNAATPHAGEAYLVVGSVSGTSPGVQAGAFNVPLNPDFYTNFMLQNPNVSPFGNTLGALNGNGRAVATVTVPPGLLGISGLVLNHAFVTVNGLNALAFVSEAASLTIVP